MVKEVYEDAKGPLYPPHLHQRNQAAVGIEICCQVMYQPLDPLWACLLIYYHHQPVVHDGVHDNVENRWREGSPCVTPWIQLKGGGMIPSSLFHHGEPSPVRPENPDFLWAHVVTCQDVQELVPVQGDVCLLEVQSYII